MNGAIDINPQRKTFIKLTIVIGVILTFSLSYFKSQAIPPNAHDMFTIV